MIATQFYEAIGNGILDQLSHLNINIYVHRGSDDHNQGWRMDSTCSHATHVVNIHLFDDDILLINSSHEVTSNNFLYEDPDLFEQLAKAARRRRRK